MFVERARGSGWPSVRRAMFVERTRGSGSPSVRRAMFVKALVVRIRPPSGGSCL